MEDKSQAEQLMEKLQSKLQQAQGKFFIFKIDFLFFLFRKPRCSCQGTARKTKGTCKYYLTCLNNEMNYTNIQFDYLIFDLK